MGCMKQSQEGARVLIEYCAGALDPVQAAEVERHLESCTDCRELAEKQMELWEALDGWKAPQVSADFDARLYARIAREQAAPSWKQWVRRIFEPAAPVVWWKPLASLGVAGAVLAVGLMMHTVPHPAGAPQVHADQVDIEQVAKALDDLDILAPVNPM